MAKENAVSSCAAQTNKPGDPQRTCNKQEKQNKKKGRILCRKRECVSRVHPTRILWQATGWKFDRKTERDRESTRVLSLLFRSSLVHSLCVALFHQGTRALLACSHDFCAVLLFCFLLPLTPPLLVLCEVCFVLFLFFFWRNRAGSLMRKMRTEERKTEKKKEIWAEKSKL